MSTTKNRDEIALELSLLTSTERRLTASEERRRQWLVKELETADVSAGVERVRALQRDWLQREPT